MSKTENKDKGNNFVEMFKSVWGMCLAVHRFLKNHLTFYQMGLIYLSYEGVRHTFFGGLHFNQVVGLSLKVLALYSMELAKNAPIIGKLLP